MGRNTTLTPRTHWEAWYGTQLVECGETKAGRPKRALVTMDLIAHTVTDMRAIKKANPHREFVEVTTDGKGHTRRKPVDA